MLTYDTVMLTSLHCYVHLTTLVVLSVLGWGRVGSLQPAPCRQNVLPSQHPCCLFSGVVNWCCPQVLAANSLPTKCATLTTLLCSFSGVVNWCCIGSFRPANCVRHIVSTSCDILCRPHSNAPLFLRCRWLKPCLLLPGGKVPAYPKPARWVCLCTLYANNFSSRADHTWLHSLWVWPWIIIIKSLSNILFENHAREAPFRTGRMFLLGLPLGSVWMEALGSAFGVRCPATCHVRSYPRHSFHALSPKQTPSFFPLLFLNGHFYKQQDSNVLCRKSHHP